MPRLRTLAVRIAADARAPLNLIHAGGAPIHVTVPSSAAGNVEAIVDREEKKLAKAAQKAEQDAHEVLTEGKSIILTAARDILSESYSEFEVADVDPRDVEKKKLLAAHKPGKDEPSTAPSAVAAK